jgi:hypothetical protein
VWTALLKARAELGLDPIGLTHGYAEALKRGVRHAHGGAAQLEACVAAFARHADDQFSGGGGAWRDYFTPEHLFRSKNIDTATSWARRETGDPATPEQVFGYGGRK